MGLSRKLMTINVRWAVAKRDSRIRGNPCFCWARKSGSQTRGGFWLPSPRDAELTAQATKAGPQMQSRREQEKAREAGKYDVV